MKTFLVLCAFLFVSMRATADEVAAHYWVVGSYSVLKDARMAWIEATRTSSEKIRIARVDLPQGVFYRLVVARGDNAAAQKQKLQSEGLAPWAAPVGGGPLQFVATPGHEKIEYRLVVGSFRTSAAARVLVKQLGEKGFTDIATEESGTHQRVELGPYAQRDPAVKSRASDAGIDGAWWVAKTVMVNPPPAANPVAVAPPPPAAHPTPVPPPAANPTPTPPPPAAPQPTGQALAVVTVNPPAPGEDYFDYCMRKATPSERERYCGNDAFADAVRAVGDRVGSRDYFHYCTEEASPAERAKYCNNSAFTARNTQ